MDDERVDLSSQNDKEALNELRDWAASCKELWQIPQHEIRKGEHCAFIKPEDSLINYLKAVTAKLPRRGLQLIVSLRPSGPRGMPMANFSTAWEFDFTMIFREQAAKWALHANYLMESAIITVHRFIYEVMEDVFEHPNARKELQDLMSKKILKGYRQAWDHKEILVKMELGCRCQTYNPNLEEAIMKIGWEDSRTTLVESYHDQKRQLGSERAFDAAVEAAFGSCAPVDELHDILQAYYKIATDRFPDNICRQAVSYFLPKADESPVKIPTAEFIANLSDSQLERIAGEDAMTRAKRLSLEAELEPLEKALKVLRE